MSSDYLAQRCSDPNRLDLYDAQNSTSWLATFTYGAYTVTLAGPERSFAEQSAEVTHSLWVRALPTPFNGELPVDWLTQALAANQQGEADILALAMQYLQGAAPILENDLQIAGDASYGPLLNGERQEGADFNDYLGIPWSYVGSGEDQPERTQFQCLDCSGYVRMIWGYRHHLPNPGSLGTLPLSLSVKPDHSTLPRRAWQMGDGAPGLLIVPNRSLQIIDFSQLHIGDLVFFDADDNDGSAIDHVGIYLGLDSAWHHRFISSRKSADGPTLADIDGKSILDGVGLYAKTFRAVRRL